MTDPYKKLAAKRSELFELEKADLDFGIHRIHQAQAPGIEEVFYGRRFENTGNPED